MRKGQANVFILLLFLSLSSASDQRWRKAMMYAYNGSSSSSSMMMNRVGSSILFPIHGNVYPTGYYNVTINIGHPPKPYFLDLDTGSDLTWLQCDAPCVHCIEAPHPLYQPTNDLVPCKTPLCDALHPPGDYKCESPDQCDYEVEYADGGSSLGVLVRDVFSLNYTNGIRVSPRLAIGCGYDQIPGTSNHPLDGILGLGRENRALCHSSEPGLGPECRWPLFNPDSKSSACYLWQQVLLSREMPSYTSAYQALTALLKKELSGRSLKEAPEDQTLPLCWKGRKPFRSVRDAKKYFKTVLSLAFKGSGRRKTQFELHPEAYLIISNKGNVCLGILNGTQIGLQNLNVIGDVSMQDRMVIYDNEKQVIGWSPANCDHLPRLKSYM
ncbi:Splicing factor U2af large subunit A [Hibiscus syriacus]|uniref:Splicing factor U2af large subunit A n=1 Tax=Hibiscus syriacus TaxID=106335 RepID=A0A6A2X971_HIBSY|nr:Splicing factor U2af large subunit A [Hibiscus syriacus]